MLNKKNEISFSSIIDSSSLESFILSTFNISKSKLKKLKLNKNYLKKIIRKQDCISLDINIVNHSKVQSSKNYSTDKIIVETENFVVFSKSYKEHTYPLTYNETNNSLSNLFFYRPKLDLVNQESMDRGLLYRLDFETSGLLIYAKSSEKYKDLRANFSKLIKHKEYIAIVKGHLEKETYLDQYLIPSEIKGSKMKISESKTEMHATLNIIPLIYNDEEKYTLVRVLLNQGHRHQIRVQLASIGHPIVGDELYGKLKEQRLFLHCYKYIVDGSEFVDNSLELFNLFFDFDGKL